MGITEKVTLAWRISWVNNGNCGRRFLPWGNRWKAGPCVGPIIFRFMWRPSHEPKCQPIRHTCQPWESGGERKHVWRIFYSQEKLSLRDRSITEFFLLDRDRSIGAQTFVALNRHDSPTKYLHFEQYIITVHEFQDTTISNLEISIQGKVLPPRAQSPQDPFAAILHLPCPIPVGQCYRDTSGWKKWIKPPRKQLMNQRER